MSKDIRLLELASNVRPVPVENKSKDWVLNGARNEFYQYIIDMNDDSSTNGSVNKSYADFIYGKGLRIKNGSQNMESLLKVKSVLPEADIRRIVTDFQVFGEASMQIRQTKGKKLDSIKHLPKQFVVPSIENEDGIIENYWFSRDWNNTNKVKPEAYPAFGLSKAPIQIYCVKPYTVGSQYFATCEYQSGLVYAEMERELASTNINYIKQGLSAGYIISIPDGSSLSDEEKDRLERQIKQKLTGSSNAGAFIMSFQARDQDPISITVFPTAENIHQQWDSLIETSIQKILTAHRCTSPSIVGIISSSGFSNTAEEMEQARLDLLKYVIAPKQKIITDALEEVLTQYGINVQLEFAPITEAVIEPTETNLSKQTEQEVVELNHILERYAEDTPEGYELDSKELVSLSAIQNSEQDTELWKIRYAYVGGTNKTQKSGSRAFCTKMRALEMSGKVFRKEDIVQMGNDGVNGQFAHSGGKYSIWLYGGGVNCYHRWERRIFKKKEQEDGELYKGNAMQNTNEVNVSEAKRQGAKIPKNAKDVAIAEIDKANKGRYNG